MSSELAARDPRHRGVVVVGISLAEESEQVARDGLQLARSLGRRVELVHAYTPMRHLLRARGQSPDLRAWAQVHDELREKLHALANALDSDSTDVGWYVEDGRPFEVLNEAASSLNADLIVVGAGDRSDSWNGLGSTADRLLRTASRPVFVLRRPFSVPPRKVLVGVDLSTHSAEAYRCTQLILDQMENAETASPAITVLTVLDSDEVQEPLTDEQLEDFVQEELSHVVAHFGRHDPTPYAFEVRRGDARDEIIDRIEGGDFDLLALGTHGRGGLSRLMLGSVAADCTRRANCSVLVVPPAAGHLAASTLDAPAVESLAHRSGSPRR